MASIALIGPDGTGKTTLCRRLVQSRLAPFKLIYMGINVHSSNILLPTSRMAEHFKQFLDKRSGHGRPPQTVSATRKNGKPISAGRLWATARLVNRLAEEWYRQVMSWSYQIRGYTVLYDRHFVFDFSDDGPPGQPAPLTKRLHRWFLLHLYPRPDLVIYLDAPGEVLFARKGELTVEDLEKRRQGFIRQGRQISNFIRLDATQPLDKVYAEVAEQIRRFIERRHSQTPSEDPLRTKAGLIGQAKLPDS